jgi:hypothetical protein
LRCWVSGAPRGESAFSSLRTAREVRSLLIEAPHSLLCLSSSSSRTLEVCATSRCWSRRGSEARAQPSRETANLRLTSALLSTFQLPLQPFTRSYSSESVSSPPSSTSPRSLPSDGCATLTDSPPTAPGTSERRSTAFWPSSSVSSEGSPSSCCRASTALTTRRSTGKHLVLSLAAAVPLRGPIAQPSLPLQVLHGRLHRRHRPLGHLPVARDPRAQEGLPRATSPDAKRDHEARHRRYRRRCCLRSSLRPVRWRCQLRRHPFAGHSMQADHGSGRCLRM